MRKVYQNKDDYLSFYHIIKKYTSKRMDIRELLEKADKKIFKVRSVNPDCPLNIIPKKKETKYYPTSRGFSLVFLSVVLPFSSRFWLLAFCFGCFCAEEKTSADSRLGFLLSMRIRYPQDLGGNHMTKPVKEPVLSTRTSFLY